MEQVSDGELSANLIDPCGAKNKEDAVPRGTILSSSILLASSGFGAGMLTLPITVQQAGPVPTLVLILVGACLGAYSTSVLLIGCTRLRAFTYGSCVDRAQGFQRTIFGLPLVDTFFCFTLLSCIPSFLVFIGDFLPAVGALFPGFGWINRIVAIFSSALIISLFTVFNSVNFVLHVASLSTAAVLCTAIVIVAEAVYYIPGQTKAIVQSWDQPIEFTWGTLQASGNIIFAFCISANVPAVAVELKDPTVPRCAAVALLSNALMLLFYAAIAFGGYFSFVTHGLDADVINNYPRKDPYMAACRAMLTCIMISVAVLTYVPAMKSFYLCLQNLRDQEVKGEECDPGFAVRFASVLAISIVASLVAVFVADKVNTLISWIGAFSGAVEVLYGPLVLILHGHVGNFSPRACIAVRVITFVFMVYLWTAAASDCL